MAAETMIWTICKVSFQHAYCKLTTIFLRTPHFDGKKTESEMMQGSSLNSGMRKGEHEWRIYIYGKEVFA